MKRRRRRRREKEKEKEREKEKEKEKEKEHREETCLRNFGRGNEIQDGCVQIFIPPTC
jgi:hypothetical protein